MFTGYRLKLLGVFVATVWCVLACRLFYIQVYHGNTFDSLSKNQHLREEILQPLRGSILDRYGKILSTDLAYYEFAAEPPRVNNFRQVASVFASALGKPQSQYLGKLNQNRKFVYLDRKVPAQKADIILNENLGGVFYTAEYKRFYPDGEIVGPVIGFTDVDNLGIEGLEYKFDSVLAGTSGKEIVTTDALGNLKKDFKHPVQNAINGNSIITTLDLDCQTIAYEELTNALNAHNAISGTVILMDPNTGEVLAMITLPSFDSNNPAEAPAHLRKNRSINDTFEPGSIFKLVTAAAAFDNGTVKSEDMIFCEDGKYKIGSRTLHDSKPHGLMSANEVFEYSSNIGTYKIAEKIGSDQLYRYARKFGFGTKTGIELNGESTGIVRTTDKWSKHSLASFAIGQEVTVNALQILNAFAAVANGGTLMKPHIVKAIVNEAGTIVHKYEPQRIRRVVSSSAAQKLTKIFEGVVEHGTGIRAQMPEGLLAGKTGTAQKADPDTRSYSDSDYVASFVGYYPSRNPKIVGIALLDSPEGIHIGGIVAAPMLKNIFMRIMHNPRSSLFASFTELSESDETSLSLWDRFKDFWETPEAALAGSISDDKPLQVAFNSPPSASEVESDESVYVPVDKKITPPIPTAIKGHDNPNELTIPDVRGLSIREAVMLLTQSGFDFEINGSGLVTKQSPQPGKQFLRGSIVYLLGKTDEY